MENHGEIDEKPLKNDTKIYKWIWKNSFNNVFLIKFFKLKSEPFAEICLRDIDKKKSSINSCFFLSFSPEFSIYL